MDIISFSEAATANGRIESFIENPDSTSGIVTVPKVIGAGESVTIPAGRVAVLPNVQVDGTLNIDGEVFIPTGTTFSGATFINVVETEGNQTIAGVKTFTDRPLFLAPNTGTRGAIGLFDAEGDPDAVYIQALNNERNAQYGFLKFNKNGTITPSGNIVGNITGNAETATKLATGRTINGVFFNGSGNISVGLDTQSGLLTDSFTLNSTHKNKLLVCAGTFNITLPTVSTIKSGDLFIIRNAGTGEITLVENGNSSDLSRLTILSGEVLIIQSDGGNYYRFVSRSKDFASNINATAGYTYLPNGLIMQWGLIPALSADGSVYIAFPISFPNNTLGIYTNSIAAVPTGNSASSIRIKNDYSRNGFTAIQDTYPDLGSLYLAIGY